MTLVTGALARVFVDDLDDALPLYRALSGDVAARRFDVGDVRLCWIGSFLLLQVPADQRGRFERVATLLVADIAAARAAVERCGGAVLEPPAPGPNGARMIARHADGAVFEYIETTMPER